MFALPIYDAIPFSFLVAGGSKSERTGQEVCTSQPVSPEASRLRRRCLRIHPRARECCTSCVAASAIQLCTLRNEASPSPLRVKSPQLHQAREIVQSQM